MQVTCYFDYTCPYSYRAFQWLSRLSATVPDIAVRWSTFSLKEAHHDPGTPSPFDDPGLSSLSVLALALAHAVPPASFGQYHQGAFEALQTRRVGEPELLGLAAEAGVDIPRFDGERARWLSAVVREHREATTRWQVFGTPTLIIAETAAVFLKFAELPDPAGDADVWRSLCTLAVCHPEVVEIKRPQRPSSGAAPT